ncbi:MAG TPA: two-component system response regulator [Gammaproteobacteria bacterium]|jgi:twitching motility two-component system response regulator PilH|nr:two-component system response regulator [Gammaproteobacteria bacterium]
MAHILVVDDSATDQFVFKRVLEENGHQVTVASDGREGVDLARRLAPDLVLMDVVMPGLNGFQATRELHKTDETKEIPVVMVTTKDGRADMKWAQQQGARAYIVKPAKESQLLGCISKFVKGNS